MTNYYRLTGFLLTILVCGACNRQAFPETESMKKYGLVFRLQDDKPRVVYLEKQGLADQAQAEKQRIAQGNRDLVQFFQQEFDFCPVYFYYASQQTDLLARKPVLLNSQMIPDASILLPDKLLLANFVPGAIDDNRFKGLAFRVVGTSVEIRPTYSTWLTGHPMQQKDVRKINRRLSKPLVQ